MKIEIERGVVQQALEALEEIALAGMSGCGQESEEGMRDWHARQAWKFIGIAARAMDPLREALAALQPVQQEALTDEQKRAKWISATIEQCTHENCYYRGIADAETHHGITKGT